MFFDPDVIAPWVIERTGAGGEYVPGTCSAIGRIRDGQIVGGIYYEKFNGASVMCHIASEGDRWLNKTFLWMIFDYPFRQLGAKRMTAPILDSNVASINFVEKLGFVREANLQDAHPDGDLIIYRLFADECRWHKRFSYDTKHGLIRNPVTAHEGVC